MLLDVLLHDFQRSAAAGCSKIGRAPKVVAPELALYLWEVLLPQAATGDAFQAVHQLGKLHGGRILDEQMNMVVLAVHLLQHRVKLGADAEEGVF